ncbi:VWA domain-containing protein [Paracoccus sp. TK19116]|uniref:VWA domain-containing protein n=1 Tax=Paracoccus albicereus TaxID=2922394 RepID=A0ABT1MMN6_9RHOB|nr:vWA domain-containing protein [Paracoccus albicereus]MCQ0969548.1 VWA domain-containing protein [Paracoccus albicereus]
MIELSDIVLLRPFWLIGVPLALLAGWLVAATTGGLARWRRIIDAELLAALRKLGKVTEARGSRDPWLLALAAALTCLGLAGPATRDPDAPVLRNLDAVMILLDLSPSVTEGGALDDAQAAVSRLIDTHGTRPLALGVYAAESFLVSVPTEDPSALQTVVAVVDATTMPVGGSRPDRALDLARQTLADATAAQPDVVLISDGGGIGPDALDRARRMAADGWRVSAVFVAPDRPPYGLPPADREGLVTLSDAGGGVTVEATNPAPLETFLARRQDGAAFDPALRSLRYADYGRWVIFLALLPLALVFRRKHKA